MLSPLGREAFKGCKALESVIVPKGVEEIQQGAFQGCSALRSLTLTEGLKYISDSAFEGCSSLESLVVPESVSGIVAMPLRIVHRWRQFFSSVKVKRHQPSGSVTTLSIHVAHFAPSLF